MFQFLRRKKHSETEHQSICPSCLLLSNEADINEMCALCDSEFARASYLLPLEDFLDAHTLNEMDDWIADLEKRIQVSTESGERWYLRDSLASVKRIREIHKRRLL